MFSRRNLAIALALLLIAGAGATVVGYEHRGSQLAHARTQLGAARAAQTAATEQAEEEAARLAGLQRNLQRLQEKYLRAQDRLDHPRHGRIPVWTHASLDGYMDRFAPTNTSIVALIPLAASSSTPAQVIVSWQGPPSPYDPQADAGVLIWQATSFWPADADPYATYRQWHVVYDWHYDGTHHVVLAGPPGHQTTHNALGQAFSVSVGDATGDGHPDVLASLNSSGSGGCRLWHLIATSPGGTSVIWHHTGCDTYVSIRQPDIEIDSAVHRPGCSIHGCGTFHRILLRRTGDLWTVVSRSVVAQPDQPPGT